MEWLVFLLTFSTELLLSEHNEHMHLGASWNVPANTALFCKNSKWAYRLIGFPPSPSTWN